MAFLFDSYAIIEVLKGSKNYAKYAISGQVLTNKLFLAEAYFFFLKNGYAGKADEVFESFSAHSIEIPDAAIKSAMQFRFGYNKNRKQKVSYADAMGYEQAKLKGVKFLTGDDQFEKLPNVEFVK